MRVDPYLFLNGRCEEALMFYQGALGARIEAMVRFADAPGAAPGASQRIMHAALRIGETTLLASDGQGEGPASFEGFSLALTAPDDATSERMFAALAEGGAVRMPLMSTPFSSRMGMVTDRFGAPWMIVTAPQVSASQGPSA
jgi:PhnB protein